MEDVKWKIEYLREEYGNDEAFQYCDLVFNTDQRTALKTKQACARHVRDLHEGKYVYNFKKSEQISYLLNTLIDPETRKPFTPALFQYFIFQQMAWEDDKGIGRFRDLYISLARKQGKSLLVAFIVVYQFLLGDEPKFNRQVMLTSQNETQANNMFDMVKDILMALKEVDRELDRVIKITQDEILDTSSGSTIRAFAPKPKALESFKPVVAVLDEYAMMRNGGEVYTSLQSGMSMSKYGVVVMVSTVDSDLNSAMYSDYLYVTRLLNGEEEDDRYFAYVAELEDEKEMEDERNWSKANPLLVEEGFRDFAMDTLRRTIQKAQSKGGGELEKVKMKNFNMWGKNLSTRYLSYSQWEDGVKEDFDKKGKKVYIGVDLSEREDLTSLSFVYEEREYLYIDTMSFVADMTPEGAEKYSTLVLKGNEDQLDYIQASENGEVIITDGVISYLDVWKYLIGYVEENELEVEGIYYDRYNIRAFLTAYSYSGSGVDYATKFVEVPQSYMSLSEPIKEFRSTLQDGRIKHSNNSIMNYCVKNAQLTEYKGQYLLDKPAKRLKIDALAATINAYKPLVGYQFEEQVQEVGFSSWLDNLRNGKHSF